jgi:hypothetical protein
MENVLINDLYDRLSKILKNDQKYSYKEMSEFIIACASEQPDIETIYAKYPALLDIIELGAALEHGAADYQEHIRKQAQYKLSELKSALPDIR